VAANHSAAHLLHAALRKVLGETVAQAGQMVDGEKLRFDFTYPKALSNEQLQEIEALVLNEIEHSVAVSTELMTPEKAVQSGAIALFGEKYGQEVRVLSMGEFSKELCGGTHVSNTSQVLTFKIISESSVSSGVRRIEALAGEAAIHYLRNSFFELRQAKQAAQVDATLSSDESKLVSWIEQKKTQIKELEKEVKTAKSNSFNWDELEQSVFALNQKGPAAFGAVVFVDSDDRDFLSSVSDRLQAKDRELLSVVVGRGSDSRPTIVSAPKKSALGLNAGQTLKELAAKFSGKGGGRPDFAQGNISSSTDAGSVIQFLKSIK
jgi:alanyl-tRNA synthetase